jgi:hypothetical protein
MALGGRDFHARNDQKTFYWLSIFAKRPAIPQISASIAGIMVCESKPVQAFAFRRGDQRFRAAAAIS